MKIYNRKGFLSGLFSAALGTALLFIEVQNGFDSFQPKNTLLAIVCLLVGLTAVVRSMSRRLSREDKILLLDERSQLVTLKSRSRAFRITQGVCLVLMFLFLLLGAAKNFDGAVFLGLGFAFSISVSYFSELFSYLYYESKN